VFLSRIVIRKFALKTSIVVLCLSLSLSLGVSQNLSNGLIAYYPFNGNVNDESGNGRNGAVNSAVLASDRFGNPNSAYIFNGSSSFISATVNVSEVSYTVAFWFCTTNANCGLYAVTDSTSSLSNDRHIYLNSGNLSVRIWNDETIRTSGTNYADGNWHHVAHVYDSAGTPQRIYVDGQLKVTGTKSFSDYTAQLGIIIGFSQDAVTKYAAGQSMKSDYTVGHFRALKLRSYTIMPLTPFLLWIRTLTPSISLTKSRDHYGPSR